MLFRVSIFLLTAALYGLAVSSPAVAVDNEVRTVRIGVLAFRGADKAHKRWDHIADYLNNRVENYQFKIDTFDLKGLDEAVQHQDIDFVLTNPGNYVRLESLFGATRITTLSNKHKNRYYTVYGAVILTRADNRTIRQLKDLTGRSFMAVSENAFGGFQMAWYELHQQGIDPFRDFSRIEFKGFPQDRIVMAVLNGEVDAGTVRAETFARMIDERRINPDDFFILNQQKHSSYPFAHSTRLYPEWAFARLNHTDEILARQVAIALLTSSSDDDPANTQWTIPLDYSRVHETFRVLKVGPYANTGKITLAGIWHQYHLWIIAGTLILLMIMLLAFLLIRINRRLIFSQVELKNQIEVRKLAESKLARHKEQLEEMVRDRTQELEVVNLELEKDIQERKHIEEILRSSDAALRKLYEITSGTDTSFEQKVAALLKFGSGCFNLPIAQMLKFEGNQYRVIHSIPADSAANDAYPTDSYCFGIPINVRDQTDGAICFIGNKALPERATSVDRDILQLMAQWLGGETQRMQAEEKAMAHRRELAHVSRLGTMGEMASGLAHELNQPLTAIANFTRGCMRRLQAKDADMPAIMSAMDQTVREAERAAQIIKRLRDFVSKGEVSRSLTDVNTTVLVAIDLLANEISRHGIRVDQQLATAIPEILIDHIQVEQVILNLLRNSIEALQSASGPREITITTESNDRHISLTLSDNGPGMSDEIRQNLFHPFYTTKKEGMGLGLSISRSIIEAHGGQLTILDTGNKGCAFRFTLPISQSQVQYGSN